jgi:hypothetical protein
MLGSLTALAAVVVADVARAELQQRPPAVSDALPEGAPAVVKKVVVKKKVNPAEGLFEVLSNVKVGRFEGY